MSSICSGICTFATLILVLCSGAPLTPPQEAPKQQDGLWSHKFATDGIPAGVLFMDWTNETGRKFVWRDGLLRDRRLTITGELKWAAADADFAFESMLVSAGLVLVPAGPPDVKLFMVEDVEHPSGIKSRARFVPSGAVGELVRSPAQVFTTSFALKHVSVESVRNAVSQILTNRNVEFTMDVPGANALIVVGFGPTVAAMGDLMAALDVPGPEPKAPPPQAPDKK